MRLSEAIRLGSMLRPQAFGAGRQKSGTCALRAAAEALGIADGAWGILRYDTLRAQFPFVSQRLDCPESYCSHRGEELLCLIWHLNDQHKWTREEIADWVATAESADERSGSAEALDAVGQRRENPI